MKKVPFSAYSTRRLRWLREVARARRDTKAVQVCNRAILCKAREEKAR